MARNAFLIPRPKTAASSTAGVALFLTATMLPVVVAAICMRMWG